MFALILTFLWSSTVVRFGASSSSSRQANKTFMCTWSHHMVQWKLPTIYQALLNDDFNSIPSEPPSWLGGVLIFPSNVHKNSNLLSITNPRFLSPVMTFVLHHQHHHRHL
jgi:hypothetical protein